jgi:hypothetical protein
VIRERVGGSKSGWWSGLGFVSVGIRKRLGRGDRVGIMIDSMSGAENVDPRSEPRSGVGWVSGSVV